METNERIKKNNNKIKILAIILLIVLIVGLAGDGYARYITRISGQSTADIAQWNFKVNDKTNESFTINLADTRIKANDEVQMQDGYIGPGTSGAFDIRLDATGSEVSLKYDVNIDVDNANNTKLPKNLIFYSDSTMQNAIYHENNIINLNGFIGVADNSKIHTKTVYWKWAYETGQTQSEINTNDGLDSYWMGKDISIAINVIGKQVNENPTAGEYTLTFDANGGTLQDYGNSSKATKQVKYGETYGELPIPTREGYTFVGWNGKNLFDMPSWLSTMPGVWRGTGVIGNNKITITAAEDDAYTETWYAWSSYSMKVKPNTTYTVSCSTDNTTGALYVFVNNHSNASNINVYMFNLSANDNNKTKTFTTPNDATFLKLRVGTRYAGDTKEWSNIQIEEGNVATTWEPYIINSSTEVTQNKNHTLTAIWIEN